MDCKYTHTHIYITSKIVSAQSTVYTIIVHHTHIQYTYIHLYTTTTTSITYTPINSSSNGRCRGMRVGLHPIYQREPAFVSGVHRGILLPRPTYIYTYYNVYIIYCYVCSKYCYAYTSSSMYIIFLSVYNILLRTYTIFLYT